MNKAKCSRAGRNLAKRPSSQAGRALAECRWGKKKPVKKPDVSPGQSLARRMIQQAKIARQSKATGTVITR